MSAFHHCGSLSRRPEGPHGVAARRAMTLLELLVALSILAVMSTAVLAMIQAGAKVTGVIGASMGSQWEVEMAVARMTQQVRTCTALTVPNGTGAGTSFSIVTQADAANAYQTYSVSLSLVTRADGTKDLCETDSRFGTAVLIRDVQNFDVRLKSADKPVVLVVTLTAGRDPAVSRTLRISPRNL